jgi:hypothetical protein
METVVSTMFVTSLLLNENNTQQTKKRTKRMSVKARPQRISTFERRTRGAAYSINVKRCSRFVNY